MPLVFEKVRRRHVERLGKLSNGATLRFYLVPFNSGYGIDTDSSFVRQLLLSQEPAFTGFL